MPMSMALKHFENGLQSVLKLAASVFINIKTNEMLVS